MKWAINASTSVTRTITRTIRKASPYTSAGFSSYIEKVRENKLGRTRTFTRSDLNDACLRRLP